MVKIRDILILWNVFEDVPAIVVVMEAPDAVTFGVGGFHLSVPRIDVFEEDLLAIKSYFWLIVTFFWTHTITIFELNDNVIDI